MTAKSKLWYALGAPVCFVVLYFVLNFAVYFAAMCFSDTPDLMAVTIVADVMTILICYFWMKSVRKKGVLYCDNKPFGKDVAVFMIPAVLLFCILFYLGQASAVNLMANDESYTTYSQGMTDSNFVFVFILSVIAAPVCEEFLMRGIVYTGFKQGVPKIIACILSAAVFAVLHGTATHIPLCFMFGVFLACVYEFTKKIKYCIVFHMIHNAVALFSASIPGLDTLSQNTKLLCILDGAAIIFLIAFYLAAVYGFKPKGELFSAENAIESDL